MRIFFLLRDEGQVRISRETGNAHDGKKCEGRKTRKEFLEDTLGGFVLIGVNSFEF